MSKLRHMLALVVLGTSSVGCDKIVEQLVHSSSKHASSDDDDDDDDDDDKSEKKKKKKKSDKSKSDKSDKSKKNIGAKGKILADTGFRPEKDGFNFQNTGGKYPLSPAVVTDNIVVKLFGAGACVDNDVESCKLTEPASDWAAMVNRAMNGGQCEGMAVSSLTFFENIDKPKSFFGKGAHDVPRSEATPFIGYYWAYQTLNPVKHESMLGRVSSTPSSVEDKLVEMWNRKELATLAFWGPPGHGGHAVTPYAIEDRGNGVHWIRIYDNNYPNTERYITIDRNANTWKYDLASINPDVPKMPWGGDAEAHNIVAIPLDLRLKKAECPFCRGNTTKKTVWPWSASVSISDQQGHKVGVEDGKLINEIPGAEVIDVSGFTIDGPPVEPIFILPAENDYDISLGSKEDKSGGSTNDGGADDHRGVTIFGDGSAVSVEGLALKPNEKDTLSIAHDSEGVHYKPGTDHMPALKMAVDDAKSGFSARVSNMKTEANSDVELKVDRKGGKFTVQGGSKASSYDLKVRHVARGADDDVAEQKNIPLKLGESHNFELKAPAIKAGMKPGGKPLPIHMTRGTFTPKAVVKTEPAKPGEPGKPGEPAKPGEPVRPNIKPGLSSPATPPKPGNPIVKPGLPRKP